MYNNWTGNEYMHKYLHLVHWTK